ncbi:MAG: MBL fold metallo-hydrolase [Acidobacteria bacterium]|nr:MAG: MBL fold metallo-hydrolase [Acidobacteriota bacterium]
MSLYERILAAAGEAKPPEPRDSAVGLVLRRGRDGLQVLVGLRSRRSRFLPGNWAFIGGGVDPGDRPEAPRHHARCVARELQEETGLVVPPEQWREAGERITPPIFPVRYRTRFLVAELPDGAELPARPPRPEEIEELRFVAPSRLLEEWRRGEAAIPPVLPPLLRRLAEVASDPPPLADLARELAAINAEEQRAPRIEFVPGIWMSPLETRTLPPATHTNAWIAGGERFVVVDPGTDDHRELQRLLEVIAKRRAEGARPHAVLLTHHHPDHVGGASPLARELGVPVAGHPETLARAPLREGISSEPLRDGARIDLGGMTLVAVETPGHARGHLVFHVPERGALIAGDLVSGLSTILVDPDEGGMAAYLASLDRAAALAPRWVLPAHGPPLPGRALERTRRHRDKRGEMVLAAIGTEGATLDAIAERAYPDAPDAPALLRRRQALAHLLQFEAEGRVTREGRLWRRA